MSAGIPEPSFLELPDLAAEAVGGAALVTNDEFFAEKENLLRAHPAEWREHAYTDRGKWMDGWETRRRREPGYDWCVIRLGMPGVIRGVVVDTAYFRGNYPAECSIDGCEIDAPLDLTGLEAAIWTEILPRSGLGGDRQNRFEIDHASRVTHVRLNIFPDGGVARLRIHGQVVPRWSRLTSLGGVVDLAALEHGAVVETCSDMFFGSRNNLIKPGPSRSMADGWETRRRRGPGNDWAIVRLAAIGVVERIEIDTSHFKGNAPGHCVVEGCHSPGVAAAQLSDWRPLLTTPLQPHTRQVFDDQLRRVGAVSHVRLSVFPDGGVARLRVWGAPTPVPARGLNSLNRLPAAGANAALLRCCGSRSWAVAMAALRPFEDVGALLRQGEQVWWSLGETDWLEAFAAHPKIGETQPVSGWSSAEQQGAATAPIGLQAELAIANAAYADKMGFVYIVCASGRSADDMLADLRTRLKRTPVSELRTAAEEQARITRLRIGKLMEELT